MRALPSAQPRDGPGCMLKTFQNVVRMLKLLRAARVARRGAIASLTHMGARSSQPPDCIRGFSKFPEEYAKFYDTYREPTRRASATGGSEAVESEPSVSGRQDAGAAAAPAIAASPSLEQQQAATSVSRWMFPWEKRQMDDKPGPLKTWERLYWGVFVAAIALLLFSRLHGPKELDPDALEAKRQQEERRLKAARLMLAGQTFSGEEDVDEFEGLSPQEIQGYVDKALGENASSDPFEGMSPDEINAMMRDSSAQQPAIAS